MKTFRTIFTLLFFIPVTLALHAQPVISDPVEIKFDRAAFSEDALLPIRTTDGDLIAFYDRFENKSSEVKAARLLSKDSILLCSMVPLVNIGYYEIHLLNTNDQRGKISVTPAFVGIKLKFKTDVDYYDEGFRYEIDYKWTLFEYLVYERVFYKDNLILQSTKKIEAKGKISQRFEVSNHFWTPIRQIVSHGQ